MKRLARIFFVMLFLLVLHYSLSAVYAEVPHLLNYQGRLTDATGKPLADGAQAITFRIYDAEAAGNLLWEETQSVTIQKGIFNVLLGSVTSLNLAFDKPYFLEIKVGTEVMSPRQRIASAGYAIRAEHGVPKGVIVMWSGKISDIPSGWALCDGTNGTPDLRDRFVVGARQDDNGIAKTNIVGSLTKSGGSTAIAVANLPSHSHGAGTLTTNSSGEHSHKVYTRVTSDDTQLAYGEDLQQFGGRDPSDRFTNSAGSHNHIISGSTDFTGSNSAYTPPYYALAYIIKL